MQYDWSDEPFANLVRRLNREMEPEQVAALYQRDGPQPLCVLCSIGFKGTRFAVAYHHITERGMGGGQPNQLENLAPACSIHHNEPFHSFTELWQRAMVKTGKAPTMDYGLDWELSPLTAECMGHFEYADQLYKGDVPAIVQVVFAGREDKRLDRFCMYLCPRAVECLAQTRARKFAEIKESE